MWIERFLIVVPPLEHKYLPFAWGTYHPRPVEIIITAGTFAAMALLYLLFVKFVPIISIWELKAGIRQATIVPIPESLLRAPDLIEAGPANSMTPAAESTSSEAI